MEFRILGPLDVIEDGQTIDLGGLKQRTLLAILLLHANEVVSADRLIDALWEERPPGTALKALQVYVSQLRKLVGKERLETKAPGYLLRVAPEEFDLLRFGRLQEEGNPQEALSLWRGPPLAEFAFQLFAQTEIARLEELHLACLELRVEADLARGRHAELVGELEVLVADSPLRERLRRQLMLALYRCGRQAEALKAYQEARRALVDELGIEPSKELRELHQAILNQDPSLDLVLSPAPESDSARGVFVGRERELEELVAGLDDAFAGRGRLFLLVGEPGIGKSRLADELISAARARGARVLIGRCWEAGGAPAYWPWVQSMRGYVRDTEPDTLRSQLGAGAVDLAQLLPELRERFPDLGQPPALEPEGARFRLFEAASSFLTSAAQRRPLVLVLDDLHAADEPSLLLLQYLARELTTSRLLVLGAYRNVDPTPTDPLTASLAELTREPVTRRLELAGLAASDVARFIELTSGEAPTEEFVATIHAETEGNPLFVGEIVQLLATEGNLDAADSQRLKIPQTVCDVIARRLRHLSDECNQVLVLASVLGREFGLEALAHMAGMTQDVLLEALDGAVKERVVSDVPGAGGQLRFGHVLIRDTLYEGLTVTRRVRLHRLAVVTLEALYGEEAGPHLAELAHHAVVGSDFDKALRYARRAGDRALELLAYEESARLYSTALDALELSLPSDEETRCALLLSLGEAQIRAGSTPAAKTTFLDAADLARRHGLARELAHAAAGYAGRIVFSRAGADRRVVPLLEEAIAGLGDDDAELRSRLLARLAGALRDEHSRERRDALSSEAVKLARRAGPAALAYALAGRAHAITAPDTAHEMLALASELCDVAAKIRDREQLVAGHIIRVMVLLWQGNVPGARVDLEEATRLAEELRQPAQLWLVLGQHANLAIGTGELDRAELLAARALAVGEVAQPDAAIPHDRMQRAALADLRGGLEVHEPEIRALATEHPSRPVFRCAYAHLLARTGRLTEAKRELDDLAQDDFAGLPFDQEWLSAASLLAETSKLVADARSAAVLYRVLEPWEDFNAIDPSEIFRGSLHRDLGLLATVLERWDDAVRHFNRAIEANDRAGFQPWLARTQEDCARMLSLRGAPGDNERANELLTQASTTYQRLGMAGPTSRR